MYEDNEDKGALCCSRICLFLVGAGLLGAGVTFMTSAETPERQQKVERYDTTVQEWNDKKRGQFAASSFSISAPLVGAAGAINMVEDSNADPLVLDKDGKPDVSGEILEYSPMKYHIGDNSAFAGVKVNYTVSVVPEAQFVIKATYKGLTNEINLDSFAIHKHSTHHVYGAVGAQRQRCTGMHGTLNSGMGSGGNGCRVFERLKSVCVELELDANDHWQLRRRSDHKGDMQGALNYGCDPMKHWAPAEYEYLHVPRFQRLYPLESTLASFQFYVRSSADPFIELETLTDDTYYFGMSQHQQRITGSVCIGIGLLVCISPLLWLWQCYKESRGDYRDESEPFTFYDINGKSTHRPDPIGKGRSADQYVEEYLARNGNGQGEGQREFASHDGYGVTRAANEQYEADEDAEAQTPSGQPRQIPLDRMEIELSNMRGDEGEEAYLTDIPNLSPECLPSPSAGKFSDAEEEEEPPASVTIDIESKVVGDGNGKLLQRKRI
jgi:hypothetical protein